MSKTNNPPQSRDEYFENHTLHHRSQSADIAKPEEGSRLLELSFSSETAVKRFNWWKGQEYDEILGHASGNVDLKRLNDVGVLLYNHDPSDVRNVVGCVERAWLDDKTKKCRAMVRFSTDEEANSVYQKVTDGIIRGVSVGYRVSRWEKVDQDATTSDGFTGPAMIARSWEALEISLAPVPADPSVGPGRSINTGGGIRMDEERKRKDDEQEEKKKAQKVEDEKDPKDEEREDDDGDEEKEEKDEPKGRKKRNADDTRSISAERSRAAEITEMCGHFGLDPAPYIRDGHNLAQVSREILKNQPAPVSTHRSTGAVSLNRDEADKFRSAVTDGLSMRSGVRPKDAAPGAEEFRGISLLDLARLTLERSGERISLSADRMDMCSRAFATADFPLIMSNLANKVLLSGYQEVPSTWHTWAAKGNLRDFKEAYKLRFSEAPELEPVLEGGEYKMADFKESQDSYRIGTWGKKFAITRQAIVNDDLGALTRVPSLFGVASARTINKAVYGLLKKNPKVAETGKPLFHADHNNKGTAASPTTESLSEARSMMRRQKGVREGITLNISPTYIIIPPELETATEQLLRSATDIGGVNPGVINPFRDAFTVITEAELEDPKAWYLACRPSLIDTVEVAFLDGVENPVIEQQQGWNVDGLEYKVRLDFGIKVWDYRGLYYNAGA